MVLLCALLLLPFSAKILKIKATCSFMVPLSPKYDYSKHIKPVRESVATSVAKIWPVSVPKIEVWPRFDRKPCSADMDTTKFGISMVKNPKIQSFALSVESDHLSLTTILVM